MSASSVVIIVILMLGTLLNIIMRSKTMNLEKAFIWGLLFFVILITPKIIFGSGISSSWEFCRIPMVCGHFGEVFSFSTNPVGLDFQCGIVESE